MIRFIYYTISIFCSIVAISAAMFYKNSIFSKAVFNQIFLYLGFASILVGASISYFFYKRRKLIYGGHFTLLWLILVLAYITAWFYTHSDINFLFFIFIVLFIIIISVLFYGVVKELKTYFASKTNPKKNR